MDKILVIMILMLTMTLTCTVVYMMYKDIVVRKEKQDFDKQILMAQSMAKVTTSYDDAFKIIDKMLMVATINKATALNLKTKTPEQLSIILDDVIIETSTYVLLSISDSLKRQLFNYITDDFLKKYVTDNCRRLLVIHIEGSAMVRKPIQDDKKI